MASEKTEVARAFPGLRFRLQIGQFDARMEGITPCAVWPNLQWKPPQGSRAPPSYPPSEDLINRLLTIMRRPRARAPYTHDRGASTAPLPNEPQG